MDNPNSYRNVRLASLRLAVAVLGFDPVANNLDKIIADNVKHHEHSLDGTRMAMSSAVVDRIEELTKQPAAEEPEKPKTPRERKAAAPATVSTERPEIDLSGGPVVLDLDAHEDVTLVPHEPLEPDAAEPAPDPKPDPALDTTV